MASQYPPKKNAAFTLFFTLYKNDGTVVANPGTITKKVSIDGGDVADIAASVTEEDTTYGQCSVVLSAAEMNGDAIWIYITDNTSGTVPFTATIYTTGSTLDERAAQFGVVAVGTAQSATSTTLVLAAASAYADDELNGSVVVITGGTGIGQSRVITNYTGSSDTCEVDAWATTPSGTITYVILAAPPASATSLPAVNVTQIAGDAVSTTAAQIGVNVVSASADAIDAAALADDAVDAILDEVVEGSTTLRQLLRGFASALLSKVSGGGTTTVTFRDIGDTKNRIVATVDEDGNRSAITLTLT